MIVLLDADSLIFKACGILSPTYYFVGDNYFQYKKEAIEYVMEQELEHDSIAQLVCHAQPHKVAAVTKLLVDGMTKRTKADISHYCNTDVVQLEWYLGGSGNFRDEVVDNYKANRGAKPFYASLVKKIIHQLTDAIAIDGVETDDTIAVRQSSNSVISSIDKDMRNIPGWHYNYDTRVVDRLKKKDCLLLFMAQCVTGDVTDNIKGIPRAGKVAAKKILEQVTGNNAQQMWKSFTQVLQETYPELDMERFKQDMILLDVGGYWHQKLDIPHPHMDLLKTLRR